LKLIVITTDPGLESVKEYTPVPEPELEGVPDTCQVALPPLLEDLEMINPGGIGVPETKLIFGFTRTLIVVHPLKALSGVPTFPVTFTVQLAPEIAKADGEKQPSPTHSVRQSLLNISETYRQLQFEHEEKFCLFRKARGGLKRQDVGGRILKV
jgi:hypothetical protein